MRFLKFNKLNSDETSTPVYINLDKVIFISKAEDSKHPDDELACFWFKKGGITTTLSYQKIKQSLETLGYDNIIEIDCILTNDRHDDMPILLNFNSTYTIFNMGETLQINTEQYNLRTKLSKEKVLNYLGEKFNNLPKICLET